MIGSADGAIVLVSKDGKAHKFEAHRGKAVEALAVDERRMVLYSASHDGAILVWKLRETSDAKVDLELKGALYCPDQYATQLRCFSGLVFAAHGNTVSCWIAKVRNSCSLARSLVAWCTSSCSCYPHPNARRARCFTPSEATLAQ